jgi:hypothetical protein
MRKFLVLVAVAASFGVLQVGVAHAAACGVVTSSTTLTSDCVAPLIVGASGITVDLNNHAVVCNLNVDGILVPNFVSSVHVRNGRVTSGLSPCFNGLDVKGSSSVFSALHIRDATHQGVQVDGDSNRLTAITSDRNVGDGFIVFGSDNTITSSSAADNDDDGISFFVGSDNTVLASRAVGNADKGIISGSSRTLILSNISSNNGRGIYLSDNSTGSLVLSNSTTNNVIGIEINPTSSSNRVVGNISLSNTLFDLSDDNANCDSNFWAFNVFGTRNQSCIH